MKSIGGPSSGYLTLTGTFFSYAFYAGGGYFLAGWAGAACGATLLTMLIARQIWHASRVNEHSKECPPGPPKWEEPVG